MALVAADGPAPFGDVACVALLAYTFYAGMTIVQNVDIPTNVTSPFPSPSPHLEPIPPFDLEPCPDPMSFPSPTLGEIEPPIFTFPLGEGSQGWQSLEFPESRLDFPTFMTSAKLTKGGRRKIGNLIGLKDVTAAEAIRRRGGGQGQVNQLQSGYENLTVGELANRAAQGDRAAETAIKIIKQASKKRGKYGGR